MNKKQTIPQICIVQPQHICITSTMSVLDILNYVMALEESGSRTAMLKILGTILVPGPGKVPVPGQPAQIPALRAEDVDGARQAEYWVLI